MTLLIWHRPLMMTSSPEIDLEKKRQGDNKDSSSESRALDEVDEIIEEFLDSERTSDQASSSAAARTSLSEPPLPTYSLTDPRLQPRPFNPLLNGPMKIMNGINLGTTRWQPRDDVIEEEFLRRFSLSSTSYVPRGSRYVTTGMMSGRNHQRHIQHDLDYASNFAPGGVESSLTDTKIHVNLNARSILSTSPSTTKRHLGHPSSIEDSKYTSDPFLSSMAGSRSLGPSGNGSGMDKQAQPTPSRRRSSSTKESQIRSKEWNLRYEELITYKETYGDCLVPYNWPRNKQLANWVKRQRYQYNQMKQFNQHTTLTDKRIEQLNQIGFTWNSHDASWDEKYQLLLVFHREHGHVNVPPNYNQNRCGLATWVKYQRRLYKILMSKKDDDNGGDINSNNKRERTSAITPSPGPAPTLTEDRLQKLTNLGFNFDPCDRLKKKNKKQKR